MEELFFIQCLYISSRVDYVLASEDSQKQFQTLIAESEIANWKQIGASGK